MLRLPFRPRRRLDLALDLVFVFWFAYIAVAGRILPEAVVSVFRSDAPAVVSTEPEVMPASETLLPEA
jgi:hypothetical protein